MSLSLYRGRKKGRRRFQKSMISQLESVQGTVPDLMRKEPPIQKQESKTGKMNQKMHLTNT